MQVSKSTLHYVQEHICCQNYAPGKQAIILLNEVKAGSQSIKRRLQCSTLFFLLEGTALVRSDRNMTKVVESNRLFFIPSGSSIQIEAVTDITIIACSLDDNITLCKEFTLKQLAEIQYNRPDYIDQDLAVLPISQLLRQELLVTKDTLRTGLLCYHYQRTKLNVFLLMLRGFYTKEELAILFEPLLNDDNIFQEQILHLYSKVKCVKELILLTNIPTTTFNRKFHEAFHMSAGKWLTMKKKENLRNELCASDLSINEIADKYGFTPNYLIKFCKDHLGKTPAELRKMRESNNDQQERDG